MVRTTEAPPARAGHRAPAPASPGGRRFPVPSGSTWIVLVAIVVVVYLTILPLGYLLHDTFIGPNGFTFDAFARAYREGSGAGEMLLNSVKFALGVTVFSLVAGAALGYIQVRTDAPFKSVLFVAGLAPLILPGFLYGTAWIFLADKDIGLINVLFLEPVFGVSVNIFSIWGMILVQGLHQTPIAFLLMVAAFRSMDPSLEESALMGGAGYFSLIRRITLPLLRPALLGSALLIFVNAMESFEVPALLGLQSGIYVFTSRMFVALQGFPPDYASAGAYGVTLLAIGVVGIAVYRYLLRDGKNFETVTGKAFRPRATSLGRARPVVGAGLIVFFVISLVLPLLLLIYGSVLPYYQKPSAEVLSSLTLENYRAVLGSPRLGEALRNTLVLGIGSATAVMFLAAVCSWFVARTKAVGRGALDFLTFTPLVVPGLVLGLSLIYMYVRSPLPIYGTLLILVIAYTTKYLPYGMRYSIAAMSQTSAELEESAHVSGASWWQTFRRILMPLASGGLIAGWIYVLVVSFRELSAAVLLYGKNSEVIGVLIFRLYQEGSFPSLAAVGVLLILILSVLVTIAFKLGAKIGVSNA
jgi:iron(III) transport system permease protein